MSSPFSGRPTPRQPSLPTPPTGWPIGSYTQYEDAQRAVDFLADNNFEVSTVTIVGVDLMLVERVIARLTWGRVLAGGAASGAWFGLFVGIFFSLFSSQTANTFVPILVGLVIGVVFGVVFAAAGYATARGRRDFSSSSQLVAGRYDVLCDPRTAEAGRDLLAKLVLKGPPPTQ